MIWLLVLTAVARKPDLGPPAADRCEPSALASVPGSERAEAARRLLAACPGFSPALVRWVQAWGAGEPSELAAGICPRARADLRRDLSPGVGARLAGVAKSCRIRAFDPAGATGPDALLLGATLADRLRAAGVAGPLAQAVGQQVATAPAPGRYGGLAAVADGLDLPRVQRVQTPLPAGTVLTLAQGSAGGAGPVVLLADRRSAASELIDRVGQVAHEVDGAWVGAGEGAAEHDRVWGLQVHKTRPVAARVIVDRSGARIELGAAGPVLDGPLEAAVLRARELLSFAQEFGGDGAPPDRVGVMADGVDVGQLVAVLDGLLAPDGEPRFAEVVLGQDLQLVEWPERLDGRAP